MRLFGKELKFNNNKVYHTGDKPTPVEIGAANVSHTHKEYVENTNKTSPILTNTDVKKFNVGIGKEGDYSNQMEQSLITLNNVKGKTIKKDGILKNVELHSILNIGNSTSIPLNWSSPAVIHNNATFTYTSDSVKVSATDKTWAAIQYNIDLEPNTDYAFMCDWESNSETAIVMINDIRGKLIYYRNELPRDEKAGNKLHYVFNTRENGSVQLTLYSSIYSPTGYTEYKNIKIIPNPKGIISPKIALRGLPNGMKDEYVDGVYTKRVGKVVLTKDNTNFQYGSTNGNTHAYATPLTFDAYMENGENDFINCDKFNQKKHADWANGQVGIHFSANNKTIIVDVDKSTVNSLDDFKNKYLPITVEYALKREEVYDEPISILASKGDVIHIDSPIPVTFEHQVNLNARSQIEETQSVVNHNVKSIFSIKQIIKKMKFEYSFNTNGYLKFPDIFSGLLIQWGSVTFTSAVLDQTITFPITYKSRCLAEYCSVHGRNNNFDARVNFDAHNTYQGRLVCKNNVAGKENEVSWFTIGF